MEKLREALRQKVGARPGASSRGGGGEAPRGGQAAQGAAAAPQAPGDASPSLSPQRRQQQRPSTRGGQAAAAAAAAAAALPAPGDADRHREIARLVVANGRVTLSAVDLCEWAVASRASAAAVRRFWATDGAQGAAAIAVAAAAQSAYRTPSPRPARRARRSALRAPSLAPAAANLCPTLLLPASNPLSRLRLDYSPYSASDKYNTYGRRLGGCAGCGCFDPFEKAVFVDAADRPVCERCFSGWGTALDPARPSPRRLHAHLASVLAATAARLLSVPLGELVLAVPNHLPRSRALKGDRAVRVSLRLAANWALRRLGGPQRARAAREMAARAEAARLSDLGAPRGAAHYESLDACGMDGRKHALRSALTKALAGKVHARRLSADVNVQWDLELHGGEELLRAAEAFAAVGRPSLVAIVAAAVEAARMAPVNSGGKPPTVLPQPAVVTLQQPRGGEKKDKEEGGEEGEEAKIGDEVEQEQEEAEGEEGESDGEGEEEEEQEEEEVRDDEEEEEDDDDVGGGNGRGGKKKVGGGGAKRGRGGSGGKKEQQQQRKKKSKMGG